MDIVENLCTGRGSDAQPFLSVCREEGRESKSEPSRFKHLEDLFSHATMDW